MTEFIFATKNAGKLKEINEIMRNCGVRVISAAEAGFDFPIAETGNTFEENAIIKARAVCKASGRPSLADDSGLEVDYLNGEPGVHSADFMGYDTPYGIRNRRILELLSGVPVEKRTARFICVIAAAFPDGRVLTERAAMEGQIALEICGESGFGYDPIFLLPDKGVTSAELSIDEKNAISHRGKALRQMAEQLR